MKTVGLLIPAYGNQISVKMATEFIPTLMSKIPVVIMTISKQGTPLARQILAINYLQAKVEKEEYKEGFPLVIWADSDMWIGEREAREVVECIQNHELCVWDYPLLNRKAVNEKEGIYGLGLAVGVVHPNITFLSGLMSVDGTAGLYSEDYLYWYQVKKILGVSPKIKGETQHLKSVILKLDRGMVSVDNTQTW